MDWLANVARLVASTGHPVSWVTPLGLPVAQPYRKSERHIVKTLMQSIVLTTDADALPIAPRQQRSAFPPNFVHSLDSTHMLMTAIEMERLGLDFTAVHDSYWTHPSEIDTMNDVRPISSFFVFRFLLIAPL
jgi:DNA-directed RNA polymerase